METKEVKAGEPVTTGSVTIIPVTRTIYPSWSRGSMIFCSGTSKVTDIIISNNGELTVHGVGNDGKSLDDLISDIPNLQNILDGL